jgi:dihydrofolate synthase/folylpolyglutamate synthase
MTRNLADWLDYQLRTHPQAIAMGLERVREVSSRLGLGRPGKFVITVAGTNGKGSTVAFIEAIARAAGWKVGAFTSPHLQRYNERVRIDGADVDDATLVVAFERIEAARAEIPLTYFEFGTLAALLIFEQAGLDLAILEVGLGGRLDAVNIVDPDVAVITTVDLDHHEYLGPDRESIGAEKAGILRAGKPAILAEIDPPSSVLRRAYELGAIAIRGHSDYLVERTDAGWRWREPGFELDLPLPVLAAPAQLDNAAAAIAALRALPVELPAQSFVAGVRDAEIRGRLQKLADEPEVVLDVGHNPQAIRQLAAWLHAHPKPTRAVFAALADKDIETMVRILDPIVGPWHLAGLQDAGPRGQDVETLAQRVAAVTVAPIHRHVTVADALMAARAACLAGDRVLVFGSFHTVAAALEADGEVGRRV